MSSEPNAQLLIILVFSQENSDKKKVNLNLWWKIENIRFESKGGDFSPS